MSYLILENDRLSSLIMKDDMPYLVYARTLLPATSFSSYEEAKNMLRRVRNREIKDYRRTIGVLRIQAVDP